MHVNSLWQILVISHNGTRILSLAYFLIKTRLLNSLSDIDELSMGKSNQLVKNLIILSTFCAFHRKLKIRSNYAEFSSYSSFHFCGIWYLPYFCIIVDFCSRRCSADRNWRGKKCRRTAFPLSFHLLLLLLFYDLISFQNIVLRFNGSKVTGIAALTIQPAACYANWQLLVVEQQKNVKCSQKKENSENPRQSSTTYDSSERRKLKNPRSGWYEHTVYSPLGVGIQQDL